MTDSFEITIEAGHENDRSNTDLTRPFVTREKLVNEEKIFIIKRIMKEKPAYNFRVNLFLICLILIINRNSEIGMDTSFLKRSSNEEGPNKDLSLALEPIYISFILRAFFSLCAGF